MTDYFAQRGHAVRFGWGPTEAAELASPDGCLVVIDVLSFTTAVSVVTEAGGLGFPYPGGDASAPGPAERMGAKLAVGRRQATGESPWSLSPAALRAAPEPG